MGSVAGHVIPGSFALLMGIAWIVNSFWAYLTTKFKFYHTKPTMYTESHLETKSYIPQLLWPKFPVEPVMKLLLSGLGIIVEYFFFVQRDENGHEHVLVGFTRFMTNPDI